MWGAIIGAALSLGSMGINAISGANESRKRKAELDRQERENQAWYDRRYNEAGRERKGARRALEAMAEAQRERMASVRGKSAVMGGSNAIAAAESAAANRAIGDTVGRIDAAQEARQDAIERDYRQTKRSISNARVNASIAQSRNLANAASQASAIAGSIVAGLDSRGGSSSSKSSGDGGSSAGKSAVSGGTTASQVGWKAPNVVAVNPNSKVVKAPDQNDWRRQFDERYYKEMRSLW